MRSGASRPASLSLAVGLVAITVLLPRVVLDAQPATPAVERAPTRDEIGEALQRLRDDPDFAPEREVQTLRWTQPADSQPGELPGWFTWLRGFGRWMTQSARYLIWVSAGLAAAWLATALLRAISGRRVFDGEAPFIAPTHVGELDIRPETLPSDVGAAARALWDRGEQRAALALLYRGLLSRLAHVHRLPIRDSTTEGDCLALTAAGLAQPTHAYAERLVRVWQRFVYGQQPAATPAVHHLCDEFSTMVDRAAEGPVAPRGAAAPGDLG